MQKRAFHAADEIHLLHCEVQSILPTISAHTFNKNDGSLFFYTDIDPGNTISKITR